MTRIAIITSTLALIVASAATTLQFHVQSTSGLSGASDVSNMTAGIATGLKVSKAADNA